MIILEQLVSILEPLNITGQINRPVSGICFDSREVKPGEVFVAIQGLESDGNAYQKQAIEARAAAMVSEDFEDRGRQFRELVLNLSSIKVLRCSIV